MSTNKLRVAVVQAAPVVLDLDATLHKLSALCATAAGNGAKFIMFPEAFLTLYPRGSFFGAQGEYYGDKAGEGREKYRQYWESSIDIPGPVITKLSEISKENQVYMVVGVIERDGGTLYCTAVHFDNHGHFLGKHRKLVPTFYERMVWGRGDGSTIPIYNSPVVGTFGSVICWENYMPLMRQTMYSRGIQIYCAPNADGTEEWNATIRHIGLEGRCFVLSCNQFTRKSDYPPGYLDPGFEKLTDNSKDPNFIVHHGGSAIVSPFGKFLAGPIYDEEATLYADLDLGDCIRGKLDLDVSGHYSRPDVFSLSVNSKENKTVVFQPETKKTQKAKENGNGDELSELEKQFEQKIQIHQHQDKRQN